MRITLAAFLTMEDIKELKEEPFNEAIRSEIHVREKTRTATASNCPPCLSNSLGTWGAK